MLLEAAKSSQLTFVRRAILDELRVTGGCDFVDASRRPHRSLVDAVGARGSQAALALRGLLSTSP